MSITNSQPSASASQRELNLVILWAGVYGTLHQVAYPVAAPLAQMDINLSHLTMGVMLSILYDIFSE